MERTELRCSEKGNYIFLIRKITFIIYAKNKALMIEIQNNVLPLIFGCVLTHLKKLLYKKKLWAYLFYSL